MPWYKGGYVEVMHTRFLVVNDISILFLWESGLYKLYTCIPVVRASYILNRKWVVAVSVHRSNIVQRPSPCILMIEY